MTQKFSDDTPMLTEGQRAALDLGVSPLLADVELLSLLPPCKIYVAEHDVLKSDGYLMHARFVFNYCLTLNMITKSIINF